MGSWKCGSCGVINFADSVTCRRCATAAESADTRQLYQPEAPTNGYAQPPGYQNFHNPQAPPPAYPNANGQSAYGQQYPPAAQNWQAPPPQPGYSSAPQPPGNPPANWGAPQQTYPQPPQPSHWQQPQAPQPYGNQPPAHHPYAPNQNYAAPQQPDYSRAPTYGAPSAGSYQPSFQMMNNWNQGGVWREGDKLVMHKLAALPDRCIKCNVPTNGSYLHRKLTWINPLWTLLFLASWVIYLIVYFIIRKTAEIDMGLCEEHKAARRTGILVGSLCSVLGVGAFIFAIAAEAVGFVFIGILLLLGGLIYAAYAGSVIGVSKMDDQYIWLKRVNADYLNSFPPSGGY